MLGYIAMGWVWSRSWSAWRVGRVGWVDDAERGRGDILVVVGSLFEVFTVAE